MINLLNGSVTDRINYAKSIGVEKLASELEATKPLLAYKDWFHELLSYETTDGEVKTTITAYEDEDEVLKSVRMSIRVNGNEVFSVNYDGVWHEARYNSDGSKSYDEFGTGTTSEYWAKYTRSSDSELYVMTDSNGQVVTEVEADVVGMAISPD